MSTMECEIKCRREHECKCECERDYDLDLVIEEGCKYYKKALKEAYKEGFEAGCKKCRRHNECEE